LALTFNVAAPARLVEGRPLSGTLIERRRSWRLLIQHGAGSLDAAVSQARARNLWLSFGMLGVLATGIVIVMANARRSQQLAARQMDFVATVSHELRTPLAVIRSAAQNLSAGVVGDPAQARRYGTLIEDEGRRLTDMVEQVMDYAGLEGRGRVREPRPVDVPALVEQVAVACRPACEAAGCALAVSTTLPDAGEAPVVMGDEAALGRVVTNLVTNAAKHGADGAWVGVTVSSCTVKGGREVLITVSDRGRGIDASDLAHVFEPFRRGRRAIEQQVHGNGLGLSLVKRIVEAHGGRVAVTSAPGEGATFVVYLPARAEVTAEGHVR
jgi:signal transduction histidine kinase